MELSGELPGGTEWRSNTWNSVESYQVVMSGDVAPETQWRATRW